MIDSKVFNVDKTDYSDVSLILGGQDRGLFDTVNKQFPEVWKNYKSSKSQDWDEQEFNYSSCRQDFRSCTRAEYDMMIKTLAWQWEADSVASSSIAPVLAPFISSSELWAAWLKVSEIEVLHAATYSEIVRCSFDNPSEVLDEVLAVKESLQRLSTVGRVMSQSYQTSHKYALGLVENNQDTYNDAMMFVVALYALERIQFMSSFAVTFALCDTGLFQPIGKAIQKIAQDELECHVQLDKIVLKHEMKTERGITFLEQKKDDIKAVFDEVVESELAWVDYLFSEGRELVGLNADILKKWVLFNAKDCYDTLKVGSGHPLPKANPLKFMENWLDISKIQPAPQEQDVGMYRLNIMTRDDAGKTFDVDF